VCPNGAARRQQARCARRVLDCPAPWLAIAGIAGLGIRVAVWYRAPEHQADATDGYAARVRTWMPPYTVADIADTFADYALSIVRAKPTP
jgi:hypothetical protein